MAYVIKILLLVSTFVVVYYNKCVGSSTTIKSSSKEDESEFNRFDRIVAESTSMYYKLAQLVMKKPEFENCTMVLLHRDKPYHMHMSLDTELIIQQNARLKPIIYFNWNQVKGSPLKEFKSRHQQDFKFSEKCYVVFGEFVLKDARITKFIESVYKTFLPNAKFIFRVIPELGKNWLRKPTILNAQQADLTWDVLESVVTYNKLNQMRLLLYSFCPHCIIPGSRARKGFPIVSAGMGSDGVLKEYRSSLFPKYAENFHQTPFHLIYHPSTLTSVADMETSISTEANHAFRIIDLVAASLNISVDISKMKYAYEIGSKIDGTWNGYIGQLMSQPNSIGLAFTHHKKYSDDIQVSHPYGIFSIGMIYMDATVSNNMSVWVALSQILTKETIIFINIYVFFTGAIFCCIEKCQKWFFPTLSAQNKNQQAWDKYSWWFKWMDYSWLPVKIWFQQTSRNSHLRLRTALLFIILWWFAAIYYSTYVKTFLISVMTHAPKEKLVKSLADLVAKEEWEWGTFLKPSVWSDLVGNSSFKELTEDMQYFDSHASCIDKVSQSRFACIGTANVLKTFLATTKDENSHLIYVDTELLPSYLTLAFRKYSPFADIISKNLQFIVEGEIQYGAIKHNSEVSDKMQKNNLNRRIQGEDVDLSFKEQLVDSLEEIFEDEERVEDIWSFIFIGFLCSLFIFVLEQTYFSIRNARNLMASRNRQHALG